VLQFFVTIFNNTVSTNIRTANVKRQGRVASFKGCGIHQSWPTLGRFRNFFG